MRLILATCFLIAAGLTDLAAADDAYLPRALWTEEGDWAFKERWVGGQLRAMGEPSLVAVSAQGSDVVYRMTVVPSFQPAYAIRVTQNRNGSGEAVFVQLNGAGGYDPGTVQTRRTYDVSRARMSALRDRFEEVGFWNLTIEPVIPPSADDEEMWICVDGTLLLFEAVVDGRYHAVFPENCPGITEDLARLSSTFQQIAHRSRR